MDPVIFEVGSIQIRYFSVLLALGLIILFIKIRRNLHVARINLTRDETLDWFCISFLYGVIGARLYYIGTNLDYYLATGTKWFEVFAIWRGGFSIEGGFIGAIIALWIMCVYKKIPFFSLIDQIVAPLLIVQALICVGRFINGDVAGIPTDLELGVIFEYGSAAEQFPSVRVHPTWIYCSLLYLTGFFIIDVISRSRRKNGLATVCYAFWYSSVQLLLSYITVSKAFYYGFSVTQLLAGAGVVVSIGAIFLKKLYIRSPYERRRTQEIREWTV